MNKQKNRSFIAIVYFFSFYKQTKDFFWNSLSLCSLSLSLSLQQITPTHKIKHDAYKYDLSPSDNGISSLKDVIMM